MSSSADVRALRMYAVSLVILPLLVWGWFVWRSGIGFGPTVTLGLLSLSGLLSLRGVTWARIVFLIPAAVCIVYLVTGLAVSVGYVAFLLLGGNFGLLLQALGMIVAMLLAGAYLAAGILLFLGRW